MKTAVLRTQGSLFFLQWSLRSIVTSEAIQLRSGWLYHHPRLRGRAKQRSSISGCPCRWALLLNDSPGWYQHFEWWRKSVWQWGPEFSSNWEGDSVGKPSNTTETANRYRRSQPKDTAGAQNFLGACTKVTRERSSQNLLGYMYSLGTCIFSG